MKKMMAKSSKRNKLAVYDPVQSGETVFLKLVANKDKSISCIAVDANGEPLDDGTLLTLTEEGIKLPYRLNPSVPIARSYNGRINMLSGLDY